MLKISKEYVKRMKIQSVYLINIYELKVKVLLSIS